MSPPADVHGDDVWSWDDETNKNFSIRSAYKLITKTDGAPTSTNWKQFKLGLVTETWGRIPAESCERWPSCVCDQFGHFFYNKCRASNLTCLNLAWDSGYRKVCVQTDSHVVVALLILMILQFNTTMLLR
ncbi:hypothetical protein LINPERPRIM_LOCUS4054 [Linum perenne]